VCTRDTVDAGGYFLTRTWRERSKLQLGYLRSLHALENIEIRLMAIPSARILPNPASRMLTLAGAEPASGYVPFTRVNHAKFFVSEQQGLISTSNWVGDYFTDTAGASFVFQSPSVIAAPGEPRANCVVAGNRHSPMFPSAWRGGPSWLPICRAASTATGIVNTRFRYYCRAGDLLYPG
jgi:hypothetical protein